MKEVPAILQVTRRKGRGVMALTILLLLALCTMYVILSAAPVQPPVQSLINIAPVHDTQLPVSEKESDARTGDKPPENRTVDILHSRCSNNDTFNLQCEGSTYACKKKSECSSQAQIVPDQCMSHNEFIELNNRRREHLSHQCELQRSTSGYTPDNRMEMFYFEWVILA